MRPEEERHPYQVIPGARSLWMVTMKLSPVRMREKPMMKAPRVTAITTPRCVVRVGRVERPARVDAARDERRERSDGADQ